MNPAPQKFLSAAQLYASFGGLHLPGNYATITLSQQTQKERKHLHVAAHTKGSMGAFEGI